MDKLKQYLQENSSGLDVNQPGDELWSRIQEAGSPAQPAKEVVMHPAPKKRLWTFAAAALVMVLLFAGWKWIAPPTGTESTALASLPVPVEHNRVNDPVIKTNDAPLVTTAPVQHVAQAKMVDPYELLGSYSSNYRQLVKLQLRSIRRTAVLAEDPAYFDDFKRTLVQMDRDEKNIRSVIRKQGFSEDLLEQLISIYQQKLDVLKTLQSEINKLNNRARETKPKSDSLGGYYLNI